MLKEKRKITHPIQQQEWCFYNISHHISLIFSKPSVFSQAVNSLFQQWLKRVSLTSSHITHWPPDYTNLTSLLAVLQFTRWNLTAELLYLLFPHLMHLHFRTFCWLCPVRLCFRLASCLSHSVTFFTSVQNVTVSRRSQPLLCVKFQFYPYFPHTQIHFVLSLFTLIFFWKCIPFNLKHNLLSYFVCFLSPSNWVWIVRTWCTPSA